MKKVLKENLKIIFIIFITSVVATTTTIFAYSLIAENIGYTPKDTNWDVENVDAAVDDLHLRTKQLSTNYSNDEQKVGKWINGKILYQKTFDLGSLSASSSAYSISLNTNYIENVINYNFIATKDNGITYINSSFIAPTWLSGSCSILSFSHKNGNVVLEIYNGYYTIQNAYVTLQYTKTTD